MIKVERRRTVAAPGRVIRAILTDVEHMPQLMPRVERVEVRGATDNRARLALDVRAGHFGTQRVEGETRILDDGLRFVAVRPAQIDAHWTVQERGESSEVIARLTIDTSALLGPLDRLVPRMLIEGRIARELDASLDALERLVSGARDDKGRP
jgi:carbon monoxide dehydrogenase subunit G